VSSFGAFDRAMMRRALDLAARGLYTTTPNPRVGCVVTSKEEILGEGWHEKAGGPHAEVVALEKAGARAAGATLYVTLEPCDMCVGAMFHARIARAVFGATDPKKLQLKNPVKLEGGVLAAECGTLLSGFFAAKR
jgi:diaminohydroxyphosphoribosylaminopyrimidine deaminase/5-amino-6-(5-phosphoribosylamino)uracil reductase